MGRTIVSTEHAPAAIGTYSQAVKVDGRVYLSGQIPLDPATGQLVQGDFAVQARRALDNLAAVAAAAGGSLAAAVKLNVYLTDLADFAVLNEVMQDFFASPYPARAAIGVGALPRGAVIEIDAILEL